MKYGFLLTSLGLAQIALALEYHLWFIAWIGLSFVLAGLAYGWLGPKVFGKREDGTLSPWAIAMLLPFYLLTWGLWHIQRVLTREPCCNEIVPNLWLGRRPLADEIPSQVTLVVDLTSEFSVARQVTQNRTYFSLPTLDTSVPDVGAFQTAARSAADWNGGVYVHCALGHGRSATLMAAILIQKGLAVDVSDALDLIKKSRKHISISPSQLELLHLFVRASNNLNTISVHKHE